MANRVVHFEIGADDPERAAKFYTDTFGWELKKWEGNDTPYWMVMTGEDEQSAQYPGINGGLFQRTKSAPEGEANAFICTVGVENLDEVMKKVVANGGKVSEKLPIPGVGDYAQAWDTEGNRLSLMQPQMPQK